MHSNRRPYVYDPITEESGTKAFVDEFLLNYMDLYELMHGGFSCEEGTEYISKPKDSTKRYIGRAARVASSLNPYEMLWIARIDIRDACLKLTREQRIILGRRTTGESPDGTATFLGVSGRYVYGQIDKALTRIAAILDGKDK